MNYRSLDEPPPPDPMNVDQEDDTNVPQHSFHESHPPDPMNEDHEDKSIPGDRPTNWHQKYQEYEADPNKWASVAEW